MSDPQLTAAEMFPDELYIQYYTEEDEMDTEFVTNRTIEQAVTSTSRVPVATYKRVKVEEWKLTPEAVTEIG